MDEKFELPKIGDILVEEFLEPLEITPYRLAKDLGVSTSSILDLVHNKRKISVEMALRLSKYFGTSSKFWLNMQNELDLRETREKLENEYAELMKQIEYLKSILGDRKILLGVIKEEISLRESRAFCAIRYSSKRFISCCATSILAVRYFVRLLLKASIRLSK